MRAPTPPNLKGQQQHPSGLGHSSNTRITIRKDSAGGSDVYGTQGSGQMGGGAGSGGGQQQQHPPSMNTGQSSAAGPSMTPQQQQQQQMHDQHRRSQSVQGQQQQLAPSQLAPAQPGSQAAAQRQGMRPPQGTTGIRGRPIVGSNSAFYDFYAGKFKSLSLSLALALSPPPPPPFFFSASRRSNLAHSFFFPFFLNKKNPQNDGNNEKIHFAFKSILPWPERPGPLPGRRPTTDRDLWDPVRPHRRIPLRSRLRSSRRDIRPSSRSGPTIGDIPHPPRVHREGRRTEDRRRNSSSSSSNSTAATVR
jgi:hypothetical protein